MVSLSCADVNPSPYPARLGERITTAHCVPVACGPCQSGSDPAVVNSNLTGFTRNLLRGRCDVRAFWRTPLRGAISGPPGFLPDLLLRFKKSACREGARHAENGKSSFHYRRTLIGHRLTACKLGYRLGDLRLPPGRPLLAGSPARESFRSRWPLKFDFARCPLILVSDGFRSRA